jgi:cyclophilin family peptidyl-prolyl cis-trans isomerase
MPSWSQRHTPLVAALLGAALGVVGCGEKPRSDASPKAEPDAAAAAKESAGAGPVAPEQGATLAARDKLHQAFSDAVRSADDPPPADASRPPDETVTKKAVHRILDAVKADWDAIRFTSPSGKPLDFTATIETSAGPVEIALFPEQAPNHVRNFLALARAGYYDQLFVDCVRHEQNPTTGQELHLLEAGCPLGNGSTGTGSIGYWLKAELTPGDTMSHDEGTVGACRGEEPDSAATRFYITLNKAPFLDGNYTIFGKVIAGLDVLRKIGKSPVIVDDEGQSRPEAPIVIQKVTIHQQEREAASK